MKMNKSLKYLNISNNKIKDDGLIELSDFLKTNEHLIELSLGANIISNEGISSFSTFLAHNKTLKLLDISRNLFNDMGFNEFAAEMGRNEGLEFLDIAKNKDVTDEDSLITLANSLVTNKSLKTLDLSSLQIRKPFLKQHFDRALKKNITLQ